LDHDRLEIIASGQVVRAEPFDAIEIAVDELFADDELDAQSSANT
jgi:hypothetical protein